MSISDEKLLIMVQQYLYERGYIDSLIALQLEW